MTPKQLLLKKKLDDLLDAAVSEGRSNWDSYYGHDNKYHLSSIRETTEYKEFLNDLFAHS